jgi:hypothetical protein
VTVSHTFPLIVIALVAFGRAAAAQPAPSSSSAPFEIVDNSFLLEEAFNQDPGVVQNIFTWSRERSGGWDAGFTQEWPLGGMTHQFSYTLPFSGGDGSSAHVGSVLLNYRYQLLKESAGRPAMAPRVSVVLPTGRAADAGDRSGLQTNLAVSKQVRDVYLHGNAGFTWIHAVPVTGDADRANTLSPQIAASLIWRTTPMFQLMVETVALFQQDLDAATLGRETFATISPGFRRGWNIGDAQLVVGAAVPITNGGGATTTAILLYGSYELPFK